MADLEAGDLAQVNALHHKLVTLAPLTVGTKQDAVL
jgi:hypothetical protein